MGVWKCKVSSQGKNSNVEIRSPHLSKGANDFIQYATQERPKFCDIIFRALSFMHLLPFQVDQVRYASASDPCRREEDVP